MAQVVSRKKKSSDELNVSEEFIDQNKESLQNRPKRRGGPYSKEEKIKRQNEVHRLHFEYGYSARKIAELMKINRNTVNGDLDYWYAKIIPDMSIFDPEYMVKVNLERLDIQRTRLREQLDKTDSFQERLSLERLIYEIDSKILHTYNKMIDSIRRVFDLSIQRTNDWLKENKKPDRCMTLFDTVIVSEKARQKIKKIINEDKKKAKFL